MQTLSFIIRPSDHGLLLLDFLSRELELSRNKAKALLDTRRVVVNRRPVWMARHVLQRTDRVEITGHLEPARRKSPPRNLYEDADYLVVDKPAGILTNGPKSLETLLQEQREEPSLRAVHRLDADTSGCLLLARHSTAWDSAVQLFK